MMLVINDTEFSKFQKLIYAEAGIFLAPVKKALVVGRLTPRLRELGMSTFTQYFAWVVSHSEEMTLMLDRICTNETHFFRDPRQFEYLGQELCARWRSDAERGLREKRVRIWSAACSTGEEPYSIAMQFLESIQAPGWSIDILATDLSTKVLAKAREGIWPMDKSAEIPRAMLRSYMLEGVRSQAGAMKAGPQIRSLIRFERLNLNDSSYPVAGRFDAIFCRNVLIYFNAESKKAVIERLASYLVPDGRFFLGQAETLAGLSDTLRPCGPSVYSFSDRIADASSQARATA